MGAVTLQQRCLRALVEVAGLCQEAEAPSVAVADVLDALSGLVRCDVLFWNAYRRAPVFTELTLTARRDGPEPRRAPLQSWIDHLDEHPIMSGRHGPVVAVSDVLDRRSLERTWLYQEAFRPAGIRHELGLELSHGPDEMSAIVLSRSRGRDFNERDALVLRLLRPHVDAALRRLTGAATALTPRQREVMSLVREGMSDAQIARRCRISEATVGKHLEHVYARTGARNRVQAVHLCADALDR